MRTSGIDRILADGIVRNLFSIWKSGAMLPIWVTSLFFVYFPVTMCFLHQPSKASGRKIILGAIE